MLRMPELSFRTFKHWLIAEFQGTALTDPSTIARAREEIHEELKKLPLRPSVLINFGGVHFVSSQVISLLLFVRAEVLEKSGTLVLCEVDVKIREALHIAGLNRQFTIKKRETDVVGKREPRKKPPGPGDVGWLG